MTRARDTAGIIQYNKITVDSNNAVGIGSSIPDCKLDINGGLRVVGVSTFEDAVNVNADMTFDGAGNNLRLNDNSVLELGTDNDFNIFHNSSISVIRDGGTGGLLIDSDNEIKLAKNGTGNDSMAVFTVDGAAELYYDGTKKFETTSSGISVAGDVDLTGELGSSSSRATNIWFSSAIDGSDNAEIRLGNSDDLRIYHDGTDNHITSSTDLTIQPLNLNIISFAGEDMAKFVQNGAVELYYDNSKKLETIGYGVSVGGTGSIKVPAGTTAERPTAAAGMLRYNSDDGAFEGYTTEWGAVGGGISKTQVWLFGAG